MSDASWLIVIILYIIAFLIPSIVAYRRNHHYKWIIVGINLILGVTGIGWLVAFVWAVWPKKETPLFGVFISDPSTNNIEAGKKIYTQIGQQVAQYKSKSLSPIESVELLKKYGELKNNGLISEKEFEQKKKELL